MNAVLEKRVDTLEYYLKELAYQSMRTEMELARLSQEMRDFKEEMRHFKEEMLNFKEEMRLDRKALNQRWGELANKMGTLVEDIFVPGLPEIARCYFGCVEFEDFSVRRYRKLPGDPARRREFDILAVCKEKVILVEVKSAPRDVLAEQFAAFVRSGEFFEFFPEYQSKLLIPVFAAFYLPQELVDRLTSLKIYALSMGDEHLELRNADRLAPP